MRRLDDVMRTREDSFETDLKALYEASTSCIAMYTKKEVAASRPLLHCHQIWATGGLWVSEEAFWIFDGKEPSFFQEGVCLNWWTSLCLLNLVNACLPYLFHSSILLEFRPESVRSRLGSWKEAASQERLRFQAGFLLTPFLGLSKNGVPMGAPKSSGLSSCPSKKNGYLGYPMSEQMHNGYYFGGCAILSWIFLTVLGPPIHWPGALQLWIDINRRAWKWAAQGVRGRCLTCWERAVDRAMFELLEELTSWISACSPSGLRLPRLEVLGN